MIPKLRTKICDKNVFDTKMAVFRRKGKIILPAAPLLSTQGTSHIWRKYYFRMEINKEELFYTLALWRVSRPARGRWDSGLWLSSRWLSSRLSSGQPAMAYFQACNNQPGSLLSKKNIIGWNFSFTIHAYSFHLGADQHNGTGGSVMPNLKRLNGEEDDFTIFGQVEWVSS